MTARDFVDRWADTTGDELKLFVGFDEAIVGICRGFNRDPTVVYCYAKLLEILRRMGGDEEWLETQVLGGWHGPGTPVVLHQISESVGFDDDGAKV